MKVGVAGLGRMGSAIAKRLIEVGHEVVVWNRNQSKTKALAAIHDDRTICARPEVRERFSLSPSNGERDGVWGHAWSSRVIARR